LRKVESSRLELFQCTAQVKYNLHLFDLSLLRDEAKISMERREKELHFLQAQQI
jgi:hypothetical protein